MRKSLSARNVKPVSLRMGSREPKAVLWQASRSRPGQSLSTIEVCQLFDISKATLYRWEREGLISMPSRDWRNWRLYTSTNISELKTLIRRRVAH
jgi:hypothetical protein